MPNKQLTASVRLNIKDVENKIDRLMAKIKSLNKAVDGVSNGKVEQEFQRATNNANKMEKAIGAGDKAAQRLANNLEKVNNANYTQWWKDALKAQDVAQKSLATQEALKQKELEKERIRQQSLKTLGEGDRAAQRLAQSAERTARAEKEAMYSAMFAKLEWQKSHPTLARISNTWQNINQRMQRVISGTPKLTSAYNTITSKLSSIKAKSQEWWTTQKRIHSELKATGNTLSSIWSKVKAIVGAYIGLETIKLGINTADTITSAENRLNNIEGGNPELTAESMDKMYAAAQRSRSSYSDMLSNVSKTMSLAGDSFQGNIDNAIRFQEIMSKAYTIGGASAQEQATSMYQLVQALGSGVLQGDELRSVREGAPIAYKEIEKFAQGVFNTEESLKDLASQGIITSDIVVAAIMNSEEKINESFENTQMTFAQAWDSIKNMATKAFEPALQKLNDMLNSDGGKLAIEGIGKALVILGNALTWVFSLMSTFLNWCADNWSWLQYVVIGIISAIITLLIYYTVISVATALARMALWIAENWLLLTIILTIGALVAVIIWLANTTTSGCEFMVYALLAVAAAILLIGIVTGNIALIVIAAFVILAALFIKFAQEIVGAVYWCGAVIANIGRGIANFFIALWNWLKAAWNNTIAFMVNVAVGLWNSLKAIGTNIGIAFENGWIHAQNAFWSFIQNVLEGIKFLEPAINAVAKAFGKDGFSLSGVISNVAGKQKSTKSYVSVGNAWSSGMNTKSYQSLGEAWSSSISHFDYKDLGTAYSNGAQAGANIQNSVDNFGSSIKDKLSGLSLGNVASDLPTGSALSSTGSGLLNPNDPAYALGDAYDPSGANDDIANGLKKLGNIDDTTGDIADSLDLTQEDLEYLRRIADMEWKKEFTTANITVDMTNYNTVNGENDLDGIVTKLADKLYDEMNVVADGVYA